MLYLSYDVVNCDVNRCNLILAGPMDCSLGSFAVVFFDSGFWNFDSTIPVDAVKVKSDAVCLFDMTS